MLGVPTFPFLDGPLKYNITGTSKRMIERKVHVLLGMKVSKEHGATDMGDVLLRGRSFRHAVRYSASMKRHHIWRR